MSIVWVSVSQVKTFSPEEGGCKRKWAFGKINGIKMPSTESQEFGTIMHEHAQAWLDYGTMPPDTPEGRAFKQILKKKGALPAPRTPGMGTEEEIKRVLEPGLNLLGYADVVLVDGKRALVIDHKSTKDLKYAMDADELRRDFQAIVYADTCFRELKGVEEVECRWIYYCAGGKPVRKPKGTRIVSTVFGSHAEVKERWDEFMVQARDIKRHREEFEDAQDVEPNALACGAYGGCEFANICELTDEQRLKAHFGQWRSNKKEKSMGLFDDAQKAKEVPAPPKEEPKEEAAKAEIALGLNPPPQEPTGEIAPAPAKTAKKRNTKKAAKKSAVKKATAEGLTVYIDCLPMKGNVEYQHLHMILPDAMEKVCVAHEVAHWSHVEFGKGSGALAVAFDEWLDEHKPVGVLIVDSASGEARAVREVLLSYATLVVRGVR